MGLVLRAWSRAEGFGSRAAACHCIGMDHPLNSQGSARFCKIATISLMRKEPKASPRTQDLSKNQGVGFGIKPKP